MDFQLRFSRENFHPLRNIWQLFHRPQEGRFYFLDGLRAIAILLLIGFHSLFFISYFMSPQSFQTLARSPALLWLFSGYLGVDTFFVLSGFLIGSLLLKEFKKTDGIRLSRFYLRRTYRIFPANFTVLIVLAFFLKMNLENIWANFLYLNNFLPVSQQYVVWTWSLAIEEQFYLLIPVLILLIFRNSPWRLSIFIALFLASFAIRYFLIIQYQVQPPFQFVPHFNFSSYDLYFDVVYDKIHTRYGELLLGVIAAYLFLFTGTGEFLRRRVILSRILLFLALAVILGFHLSPLYFHRLRDYFTLILTGYENVYALAVTYLILYCLSVENRRSALSRFLSLPLWFFIAQLSYSAFLVHPIVIFLFYKSFISPEKLPSRILFFGWMGIILVLIFLAAAVLYSLVEKPMMDARKNMPYHPPHSHS